MNALAKAIELSGGVTKLGAAIGVGQNVVSNWKARGKVPAEKCVPIERATNGAVTRHELRPDVFGESPKQGAVA